MTPEKVPFAAVIVRGAFPRMTVPAPVKDLMAAPLVAEISNVPATAIEDEFEMSPVPARARVWVLTVVVPV